MTYPIPPSEWSKTVRERMAFVNRRGIPTGPVPLGYQKVRIYGQSWVEVDEETAPLVQEAFRLAALRKPTLRGIIITLDDTGIVSKRGVPLSATALWRILTNPFYFGHIRYANETIEGAYIPLITKAEFEKVQKQLAKRRRR